MSHWLNPNLTEAECIEISRMKTQGFCEIADTFTKCVERLEKEHGKQMAMDYAAHMMPIIMQQYAMAMM